MALSRALLLIVLLLAFVAVLELVGCAVAIGDGSAACLDIDSRTGLVASAASSPDRGEAADPAGLACRGRG